MPKGGCSSRIFRAVNGAMVEVSGKTQHSGLGSFAWAQGSDFYIFDGQMSPKNREPLRHMSQFWIPKGACSSRVSRAVNGAMIEVSGKKQHSGLAGFAWEQGLNFCIFEAGISKMARELLRRVSEFLDA